MWRRLPGGAEVGLSPQGVDRLGEIMKNACSNVLQCSKAKLTQTLRGGCCDFQFELKAGSKRLNGQRRRDGCISRRQRFFGGWGGGKQTPDG